MPVSIRTKIISYGPTALCALIFVAVMLYPRFFMHSFVPQFNMHSNEGAAQARAFWEKEINRIGGKAAYAEFLSTYATSSPSDQHTAAHIFGGSLYTREGESGLSVCDTSFSFGCFHEFLGRAIEAQGLSGVSDLNEGCYKALGPGKALSCTHGLGHGIQSYLGYELKDLQKGLTICKSLPHGDPIGGCPGGLFMEFNTRTMKSFSGMPSRPLEPGGILYPCDHLDASDMPLCYYWQPQWWTQIFKSDDMSSLESFKKIGSLCRSLPPMSLAKCFEGAGTVVGISADYDVAKGIELCSRATEDEETFGECIISTASSYFAEQSSRAKAPELCVGLQEPWSSRCTMGATGRSPAPPMDK